MKKFTTPEIEVLKFNAEDVIATSAEPGPTTGQGGENEIDRD